MNRAKYIYYVLKFHSNFKIGVIKSTLFFRVYFGMVFPCYTWFGIFLVSKVLPLCDQLGNSPGQVELIPSIS